MQNNYFDLRSKIEGCQKCPLYQSQPFHPVCGIGSIFSKLMFVGEALGKDESLLCEPFVGDCGKFLDLRLTKLGIKREDLYISNIVHCRPTKNNGKANRTPSDEEIQTCKIWIWEEIKLVKPKVIVTLGGVPTKTLLSKQVKKTAKMGDLVGKQFNVDYCDSIIMPNWHPSYVMARNPKAEDQFVQVLKEAYAISLS